jgi:hypothetical protein
MKYTTYEFGIDSLIKEYGKKLNLSRKEKRKIKAKNILKEAIKEDPSFLLHQAGLQIISEWGWAQSEKTVIYPVDNDILHTILNGHYDVTYPEGIAPFSSSFVLHFPKNYNIAELPATSVLVRIYNSGETIDKLINPLLCKIGLEGIEEFEDASINKGLNVELFYNKHEQKGNALFRDSFPWSDIALILNDKEYGTEVHESHKYEEILALNENDKKYRHELIRTIISMLVYIQASGDALTDGLPGGLQLTTEGQYYKVRKKQDNKTLGYSSKTPMRKVNAHYRAWHIRQLKHKKYYKSDEWKDKPRGSRFVFVSDSYVNDKDIDPKTLT